MSYGISLSSSTSSMIITRASSVSINIKVNSLVEHDFPTKAKAMLLNIKDIRNKRAHDSPITGREAYRMADVVQQFFELTSWQEVIEIFNQLRLESLELLVAEEREKHCITYVLNTVPQPD